MQIISKVTVSKTVKCPLFVSRVPAGFPSPATDYIEKSLDLNELVIKHPVATYFMRASGDSMLGAGIFSGDLLVVDRSVAPRSRDVIIAVLNGEFTVKRLIKYRNRLLLQPENELYQTIEITPEIDFEVWGVVTYVLHQPER